MICTAEVTSQIFNCISFQLILRLIWTLNCQGRLHHQYDNHIACLQISWPRLSPRTILQVTRCLSVTWHVDAVFESCDRCSLRRFSMSRSITWPYSGAPAEAVNRIWVASWSDRLLTNGEPSLVIITYLNNCEESKYRWWCSEMYVSGKREPN